MSEGLIVPSRIMIEPTGQKDAGICECCGRSTRRVWGFAYSKGKCLAAYFAEWTLGHVQDQGANLDFIIGEWGDPAGPERRRSLALAYRLLETGPSMMVIDAEHRRTLLGTVAEKVLARAEVIGTALAQDAFAIADPVLAQDTRVAELLGAWKIKI